MAADGEGAQPPPPPARLFRLDRLDEEAAELTAALEAHSFVLLTGLQARRRVVALRVSLPAWLRHCICHVPPLPWSRLRHCLCLAMLQPAEATVINRLFAALQKFFAASSVKGPPLSDCLFISLPLCLCASVPLCLSGSVLVSSLLSSSRPRPAPPPDAPAALTAARGLLFAGRRTRTAAHHGWRCRLGSSASSEVWHMHDGRLCGAL